MQVCKTGSAKQMEGDRLVLRRQHSSRLPIEKFEDAIANPATTD